MAGEGLVVFTGEVMGIHHETPHTSRMQMIKSMRDERTVEDGDEGLRELLRQRTQPLAEACAEYESLIHGGGPTSQRRKAQTEVQRPLLMRTMSSTTRPSTANQPIKTGP
jgi:hypothetical protein